MQHAVQTPEMSDEQPRWQRVAMAIGGGTLLALGLRRRSLMGIAAAATGGWLAYKGIRGGQAREIELASLEQDAVEVHRTITIEATPDEVQTFLREPANLSYVLGEAGRVESLDTDRQRWLLETPLDRKLVWEMQFTEMDEEPSLRWDAIDGAGAPETITAEVEEAPGEHGSELTVEVRLAPPGGGIGRAMLERLDIVPIALVGRAMRRAKSIVETGEAPTLEANPSARQPPPPPPEGSR